MDLYHSKISNSRGEMDGRRKSTRSREYAFVFVLPTSRINSRRGAGFRDTDRRSSMKEGAGGAARGWIRLEMVEETSGKVTDGEKGGAERRRETSVHIFLCHRSRGDALLSRDKGKCGGKIAEERRGAGFWLWDGCRTAKKSGRGMEDPLEGEGCYTHATKRNRLMPDLARLHDDPFHRMFREMYAR